MNAPASSALVDLVVDALRRRRRALEECGQDGGDAIVLELYIHIPTRHVDVKVRSPAESIKTDAA